MVSRTKSTPVTWRDALLGLAFIIALMGGFGAWVVSRAEAANEPNGRAIERLEAKIDGVLLMLITERKEEGKPIPPEVRHVVD